MKTTVIRAINATIATGVTVLILTGCGFRMSRTPPPSNDFPPKPQEQLNDPQCEKLAVAIDNTYKKALRKNYIQALSENQKTLMMLNPNLAPNSFTVSSSVPPVVPPDDPLPSNLMQYQPLYYDVIRLQQLLRSGWVYASNKTPEEYRTTEDVVELTEQLKRHYMDTEDAYKTLCGKTTPEYVIDEHPETLNSSSTYPSTNPS